MTRCGSEEGTINNPECRTLDLTAEHIELVTQDHQLDVFDVRTAPAADEQAEQSPESEVGEREEHAADPPKLRYGDAGTR